MAMKHMLLEAWKMHKNAIFQHVQRTSSTMLNPSPCEVHVKHYLLRWILIVSIPTRSTSLWSPFYRYFKAVRENNIKLLFLTSQWMDLFRFALACRWDSHVWWSPTNLPRLASTKNCCAHRGEVLGSLKQSEPLGNSAWRIQKPNH